MARSRLPVPGTSSYGREPPSAGRVALAALCGLWGGCAAGGLEYLPGGFDPLPDLATPVAPPDDLTAPEPTCTDGRKNGNESDIDCGGTDCGPCGAGLQCLIASDCQSKLCDGARGVCVACNDGVRDGRETDVDCGGSDCAACGVGSACTEDGDCLTRRCDGATCASPASCSAIKASNATATDGTYVIDPDGAGAGAPITVWCDMTHDGGGWTALPLDFTDPALWSISRTGAACTSTPRLDKKGQLLSFQNASAQGWGYLSMKFVPAIPLRQVWLKGLVHATATACNNMDILFTQTPAASNDQTAEGWYFAVPADPTLALGHTFADGCNSPLYSPAGQTECSMQTTDMTTTITRQIKLTKQAGQLHMVAVQGCGSSICDANTGQAERFYLNHPPTNGLWKDGILVR